MMISRLSIVVLASMACLLFGPARAQVEQVSACTEKTRITSAGFSNTVRVRNVVKTEITGKAFDVTVYRNGTKKTEKVISHVDPVARANMTGNGQNDPTIGVKTQIFRRDIASFEKEYCNYTVDVKFHQGGESAEIEMTWIPPDSGDVCEVIGKICEGCKISCSKSFDPQERRWTTTFTISE